MSRWDNIGLFWQDLPGKGAKGRRQRIMPPIPDTGWQRPTEYPNLRAAECLSVDLETWDPEIDDHGPGFGRGKGHICGFSVGVPEGRRWYFPIRHEVEPEWNLPSEHALAWLHDTLYQRPGRPLVGANILYDAGWCVQEGVLSLSDLWMFNFVDIQFAEALLDARSRVSLEEMGHKYLGEGKKGGLLQKWIMDFYAPPKDKWRREIYRSPPRLAGPYGEGDADMPLRIAPRLYPQLVSEGMLDLFLMECALIPLLIEMRFAAVSVDVPKAEQLHDQLNKMAEGEKKKMKSLLGWECNPRSAAHLAKAFDQFGLRYPRTEPTAKQIAKCPPEKRAALQGQPSFKGDFLKTLEHPFAKLVYEYKQLEKLNGTFVKGYILDGHVSGKLYCSFHPLKGESGGTGVGRFSSSDPNLQNIPVRSELCVHGNKAKKCPQGPCLPLGKEIRSIFIPDPGHRQWRKIDYSQIQYRFLVEHAVGDGAEEARQRYIRNPHTDYHDMVKSLVEKLTGREWDRRPVKNLNFGLSFGMGNAKAGASTGLKGKELEAFLEAYHKAAPFAKKTMEYLMDLAERQGYIRTILGRRARFDLWEPQEWGTDKPPLPYDQAVRQYGRVRRAKLHKALAFQLQGDEGDTIKASLVRAYREGLFRYIGVPRLLVHDEVDHSDHGGAPEEAWSYYQRVLETTVRTRVPILTEPEVGPDWGRAEKPKVEQRAA